MSYPEENINSVGREDHFRWNTRSLLSEKKLTSVVFFLSWQCAGVFASDRRVLAMYVHVHVFACSRLNGDVILSKYTESRWYNSSSEEPRGGTHRSAARWPSSQLENATRKILRAPAECRLTFFFASKGGNTSLWLDVQGHGNPSRKDQLVLCGLVNQLRVLSWSRNHSRNPIASSWAQTVLHGLNGSSMGLSRSSKSSPPDSSRS